MFTVNGFPHGTFHGQPVKADVHAPDWRTEERVAYTLRLAEILAALLPDGVDGTISTNPLSYEPWLDEDGLGARHPQRACAWATSCAGRGSRWRSSPRRTARWRRSPSLIEWWPARPRARDGLLRRVPRRGRVRGARRGARRARRGGHPGRQGAAQRRAAPAGDAPGAELERVRRPDLPAPGDPAQPRRLAADVARPPARRSTATAAARSGACTSTCRSSSSATARSSRRRTTCGAASSGASAHAAPGDRDVHVGRAAGRSQGVVGRLDRARVRVGARCPR